MTEAGIFLRPKNQNFATQSRLSSEPSVFSLKIVRFREKSRSFGVFLGISLDDSKVF